MGNRKEGGVIINIVSAFIHGKFGRLSGQNAVFFRKPPDNTLSGGIVVGTDVPRGKIFVQEYGSGQITKLPGSQVF